MKSANDKTLNQANESFVMTTHNYNTLQISFPYEYAASVAKLNWYDILFAIEQNFFDHHAAIMHAQSLLESDNYPQAVLDLACITPHEAKFSHSIQPYIYELADTVCDIDKNKTESKVMYILLRRIFEYGTSLDGPYYDDPLNVAENIYHDFKFPESIARFAAWRNMPTHLIESSLNSQEEYESRLQEHWRKYSSEQELLWNNPQN